MNAIMTQTCEIPAQTASLEGEFAVPEGAKGVAIFAHGSGSSRRSPRNDAVAKVLRAGGIGTLLFDLLTEAEDSARESRFDIDLLAARLLAATAWLEPEATRRGWSLGYFGASTGAAAALDAAAKRGPAVRAVVSRGGRPDLAPGALPLVRAATLLLVGGEDEQVLALNRWAYDRLRCEKKLIVVPGATHLFEEPGALEAVAREATAWFVRHLA